MKSHGDVFGWFNSTCGVILEKEQRRFGVMSHLENPLLMQQPCGQSELSFSFKKSHFLFANLLMCAVFFQSQQVSLKFFENVLLNFMHSHIFKQVLQLPGNDTHTGRLQWRNDRALSGYRVKQHAVPSQTELNTLRRNKAWSRPFRWC